MEEELYENGYTGYQNMVTVVTTALSDIEKLCSQLKNESMAEDVQRVLEKLQQHTFGVGIMGEFKRGKSTVINSLLAKEIMPADILPCSATMNRVTYDLTPHVQLKMRDGGTKNIPVEQLCDYVTKLNAENESRAAGVEEAVVYYPCQFCKNGVDIIDTPGLNDDERMNEISEKIIPKLDVVVMVITPDAPFSMSEAEFVRNKLMSSDLSRLIFVVNKIDTIRRESDRVRVVDSIREKIQKSVTEKMADVYGRESEEFKNAVQKMGKIRIFPMSALDALDGKLEGDQELIEKSGTVQFEAALTKLLTEDRGALELGAPLSVIARDTMELTKIVHVRQQALELSAQEFETNRKKALEEIAGLREKKKAEKMRIRSGALKIKTEVTDTINAFYPRLQETINSRLTEELDQMDNKVFTNNSGIEAATKQMQSMIAQECESQLAVLGEQIQHKIEIAVGKDVVLASSFVSKVVDQLDEINLQMVKGEGVISKSDLVGAGVEFLTGMGVGGMVAGFRNAGVKGALVGGGVGFVTTLTALSLMAELALGGPLVVLACTLAGTLAGKFSVKKLFQASGAQKKKAELKASITKQVESLIAEMQTSRKIESWACDQVEERYNQVIINFEGETERLLKSTEESMNTIRLDIAENDFQRQKTEEKFEAILSEAKKIIESVQPVTMQVKKAMEAM